MSYQGYQDRMFELKVKVANAESLLAVAEKLSDKSGMIACRQIIVETRSVLQSTGPLTESVQRLGNALRQQADAGRRTPSVSTVCDLPSMLLHHNTYQLWHTTGYLI